MFLPTMNKLLIIEQFFTENPFESKLEIIEQFFTENSFESKLEIIEQFFTENSFESKLRRIFNEGVLGKKIRPKVQEILNFEFFFGH